MHGANMKIMFVSLFSWRYNPLWLYFHSPVAGFGLLVYDVVNVMAAYQPVVRACGTPHITS
jgi:hypothetical protein